MEKFLKPEQFNPSDKKYKEVKDLPEEHRDRFVDVPEEQGGGFVKEEASRAMLDAEKVASGIDEKKQKEIPKNFLERFDKFWQKGYFSKVSPLDILHGNALDEKGIIEARNFLLNEIETGDICQRFDMLDSEDEKVRYADEVIGVFVFNIHQQAKSRIESLASKKIKELGHDGLVFLESCNDDGCLHLTGTIDGKNIDVHSRVSGKINSVGVDFEEGGRLISAYGDIAINLIHPYGHGNRKYEEVINSAVSYAFDGLPLFGTSFRDRDGSFNKGWARDYVQDDIADAVKDLMKDNERVLASINYIANNREKIVSEQNLKRREAQDIAEKKAREVKKSQREAEIKAKIGDLMPVKD